MARQWIYPPLRNQTFRMNLKRIGNAGGRVTRDALTFRCLGQSGIQFGGYLVNGMLPMSRAGDFHIKMNIYLHPMGQACYPDILTVDITHDAEFLRIASDGIWKANPAMPQVGSSLRQARSNASISKALSNFTLGEEKSGVTYAKSSMEALLPHIEDAHAAILDLDGYRTSSFGFYDGFGGANIAQYCANKFPIELLKDEEHYNNLANAMGCVFFRMDEQLLESDEWKALDNPAHFNLLSCFKNSACLQVWFPPREPQSFEGSTASVTLIRGYQIIAASVGDSQCVFLRNGKAMDLSTVEKPNIPDESQRIGNAGGRVTRDALTFRCLGQSGIQFGGYLVNGMLPMSRAGDFHIKLNRYLHPMGQACDPDILTVGITHDTEFLRIASDGIWDILSRKSLDDFVHSKSEKKFANVKDVATIKLRNEVQYVASSEPSPENTIIVSLDDSLEDFRESYIGLGEISELCYNNGKRVDISKVYDGQQEMFTTPSNGFFCLKLVFGQRHLFFPVIANNIYIFGWKGGKGGPS